MQGEIFHTTLPSPLLVLPPLLRLFFRVPGVIITPLFFAFSRLFFLLRLCLDLVFELVRTLRRRCNQLLA